MIPRIFHHVWVGPDPFPEEFETFRGSWRRCHPGWELRLWTEETLPRDFRRREIYERLRLPAERSDMIRLELLHRFGGVYLDTDFECRRSIEPLLEGVSFFVADIKPGRINNAIIGAVPQHPLLDRAIETLKPREYPGLDKRGTGSLFLDNLIKSYPEVTVFSRGLFYPHTPELRDQAYAVHHCARSWKDREAFRGAALKAEERLDTAYGELEEERRRHRETRQQLAAANERLAALEAKPAPEVRRRSMLSWPR